MAEVNYASSRYDKDLNDVLDAIVNDLGELRTAIAAITAKLDSDGGVTDTDYASSCDPSALTVSSD